jgi:hypothetical protein
MNIIITNIEQRHERFFGLVSYLRSPFLLLFGFIGDGNWLRAAGASSIICPM